jgi:hypothetical protein
VTSMTASHKSDSVRIRASMRKRAHRGRGDVFRWLYEHHKTIEAGFKATAASWDSVVSEMIADGVSGRSGAVPNSKSVARVWVRVCDDIAAARHRRSTATRGEAPRIRPDPAWQPPVVARRQPESPPRGLFYEPDEEELPPRRATPEAPAPTEGTPKKKMTIDDLSPEARAKIDKLRRQFAETDRKRFGSF